MIERFVGLSLSTGPFTLYLRWDLWRRLRMDLPISALYSSWIGSGKGFGEYIWRAVNRRVYFLGAYLASGDLSFGVGFSDSLASGYLSPLDETVLAARFCKLVLLTGATRIMGSRMNAIILVVYEFFFFSISWIILGSIISFSMSISSSSSLLSAGERSSLSLGFSLFGLSLRP